LWKMLDEKYFRHKLIYVMNPFITKNKVMRLYAYYPRRYETFPFLHKKYILLLKTKITCKWNPHEQQLWYSKVNHLNRIHNVNWKKLYTRVHLC
jgi:hypothetical protein